MRLARHPTLRYLLELGLLLPLTSDFSLGHFFLLAMPSLYQNYQRSTGVRSLLMHLKILKFEPFSQEQSPINFAEIAVGEW